MISDFNTKLMIVGPKSRTIKIAYHENKPKTLTDGLNGYDLGQGVNIVSQEVPLPPDVKHTTYQSSSGDFVEEWQLNLVCKSCYDPQYILWSKHTESYLVADTFLPTSSYAISYAAKGSKDIIPAKGEWWSADTFGYVLGLLDQIKKQDEEVKKLRAIIAINSNTALPFSVAHPGTKLPTKVLPENSEAIETSKDPYDF